MICETDVNLRIAIYKNKSIRYLVENGSILVCSKDLCGVLDYSKHNSIIGKHKLERIYREVLVNNQLQKLVFLSKSDVIRLIERSTRPEAKELHELICNQPEHEPEGEVMSNKEITLLNFETASIRTVEGENGEILYCGKDVCDVLGYANSNDALKQHCKGIVIYYYLDTPGGNQKFRFLTEPDVYRLVFKCTLPVSQRFEKWLFEVAAPSQRRHEEQQAQQTQQPRQPPADNIESTVRALYIIEQHMLDTWPVDKNLIRLNTLRLIERNTGIQLNEATFTIPDVSPSEARPVYNSGDIGAPLGLRARDVNIILRDLGFQYHDGRRWVITDKGHGYGLMHPYMNNGHADFQAKWYTSVRDVIRNHSKRNDIIKVNFTSRGE